MVSYQRRVQRVLMVALGLNAAVAIGKLFAGWQANSLSIIGDGLHSGVDAIANIAALVVIRYATAPPDEDHPYGHARYETLAAFILGGLLFLTAFELARSAILRIAAPEPTYVSSLTIGIMLATLAINIGVAIYETRAGRRERSEVLLADAAQTRADIYVTLAVLAGLALAPLGIGALDPAIALAVAASIAWSGYKVYRDVLPTLSDAAVFDPHEVAKVVRTVPGVVNVHDIRSRGSRREPYVQLHLVVDRHDVAGAHEIADAVERALEEKLGVKEALVHVEPEDDASGPPGSRGDRPLGFGAVGKG